MTDYKTHTETTVTTSGTDLKLTVPMSSAKAERSSFTNVMLVKIEKCSAKSKSNGPILYSNRFEDLKDGNPSILGKNVAIKP